MRSSAFGAFCFSLIQVVLALALGEHLTVTGELALITVFGNSWRFASFNGLGGIFWNFFFAIYFTVSGNFICKRFLSVACPIDRPVTVACLNPVSKYFISPST